jgi:putative SOS response-associated peptidase YedK
MSRPTRASCEYIPIDREISESPSVFRDDVIIHNRMPVLFTEPSWWGAWLDPKADTGELMKMLAPADDDLLETFPVTRELLRRKEMDASVLAPVAS